MFESRSKLCRHLDCRLHLQFRPSLGSVRLAGAGCGCLKGPTSSGGGPCSNCQISRRECPRKPSIESLGFHHWLFVTSSRTWIARGAVRGGSVIEVVSMPLRYSGSRHAGALEEVGRVKSPGGTLLHLGGPDWGAAKGREARQTKS